MKINTNNTLLYFVVTNGYNAVIADHGDYRASISNECVPQGSDITPEAAFEFLATVEDSSSWETFPESVDVLTEGCNIVAALYTDCNI